MKKPSKAQLDLWKRRIETEFRAGRSPEETLDLIKPIMESQMQLDDAQEPLPPVETVAVNRKA